MFGMGFGEIVLIALVAIMFLGPEKLPETMVSIAKFFKSVKNTIGDAKDSIENEIHVNELKESAREYKKKLERETSSIYEDTTSEARDVKDIFSDLKEEIPTIKEESKDA